MGRLSRVCVVLVSSLWCFACADAPAHEEEPTQNDASSASVEDSGRPVVGPVTDASAARPSTDRPRGNLDPRDAATTRPETRDGQAERPLDASSGVARDGGAPTTSLDAAGAPSGQLWKPKPGTRWQWDLSGSVSKLDLAVDVYDIDGFETEASQVAVLHAMGKKVICYLSVGTYEPARADAQDFPKETLGKYWPEWDETYLDIRSEGVRAVMKKRLDMCQTKGFDAVEPDNMDMFEGGMSDTGFPLTEADGIAYAKWLANETHARGMSIGQKNASSIASAIAAVYDWALTEDCFADGWCDEMKAYPDDGKALFMCEYTDTKIDFKAACAAAKSGNFSAILKKRELDAWVEFCN
ncbi:MAG: hypothetical protein RLZZ450_220 [Pseudomonadota bacterium]|jgi:hypothetical protein